MTLENNLLSDLIVHMKYARYREQEKRRETWVEIVVRNMKMHIEKYPNLKSEIETVYREFVLPKKVLPSMRSLQFAGKPIEVNPSRIYNCAYTPVDNIHAFSEIMFLLLGGTGVGFSIQKHHISQLPTVKKRKGRKTRFLIGDSIEGWSDAVKALVKSYFLGTNPLVFDYSDIRPKGERLVTSGGKAPGPKPLQDCLFKIEQIFESVGEERCLTSLEIHDIICHIADAVLAGGIRRAALISLFSEDDEEMLNCKTGNWWELNPQRGRANNSVMLLRKTTDEEKFNSVWKRVESSFSGEPGIIFTNDLNLGYNPCVEASLRPHTFCNLVEINSSTIESQEDLNRRVEAASFIATLQAGYTDFHYLRPVWRQNTIEDSLLGISMTGIGSGIPEKYNLKEAVEKGVKVNREVSEKIGIKSSKRITNIKPAGTSSIVLGTSSGIHDYFAPYYIRRVRVSKSEAIYTFLQIHLPEVLEDDVYSPEKNACIVIPQKAPVTGQFNSSPVQLLERIKFFYDNWVLPGHLEGENTHNISATIYIRDGEWEEVRRWMWENREHYQGLSTLRKDNNTYQQPPFEEITEEEYNLRVSKLHSLDLTQVIEMDDKTSLKGEAACGGGACELV